MRKMMLTAVALLMVAIGFNACGNKAQTDEEKVIAGLEELLDFCKSYEVKSFDDAANFEKKVNDKMEAIDKKYGDLDDESLNFSEEQQEYVGKLNASLENEMNRILQSASSLNGINIDDIESDDLEDVLEDVEDII